MARRKNKAEYVSKPREKALAGFGAYIADSRLGFLASVYIGGGWYLIDQSSRGKNGTGERRDRTHKFNDLELAGTHWIGVATTYMKWVSEFDRVNYMRKRYPHINRPVEAIVSDMNFGNYALIAEDNDNWLIDITRVGDLRRILFIETEHVVDTWAMLVGEYVGYLRGEDDDEED